MTTIELFAPPWKERRRVNGRMIWAENVGKKDKKRVRLYDKNTLGLHLAFITCDSSYSRNLSIFVLLKTNCTLKCTPCSHCQVPRECEGDPHAMFSYLSRLGNPTRGEG